MRGSYGTISRIFPILYPRSMLIGCFYRFKKTVNQLCTVTNVYTYRIETERNTNLLIHKYTWLSLLRTAAKASVALLFRPPPRDDAIAAGQDTTARQKEKKPIVTRIRLHELYINLNDTKPQDSFKQHRFPPRRGGVPLLTLPKTPTAHGNPSGVQ